MTLEHQHEANEKLIQKLIGRFTGYWLPVVRNLSVNTVKTYKDDCKSYVRYLKQTQGISTSKIALEHFTREQVQGFIEWLKSEGCGISTINHRLTVLKLFARYAMNEDPATMEYLCGIDSIPKLREPKRCVVKHLTHAQLNTLLKLIEPNSRIGRRDLALILMLYHAAGRVSEVIGIRLKDLNVDNGKVVSVRLRGKGDKVRIVPFEDKQFLNILNAYLKLFHSQSGPDDYLFYTNHESSKRQMHRNSVDAMLKKYNRKAKEQGKELPVLHCHMMRHSKAMHLRSSGIPIFHIKDFLGHASITSTSIYAWTDVATMRKELKEVAKARASSLKIEEDLPSDPDAEALKTMGLD